MHRRALYDALETGGRQRLARRLRDDALQPVVDELLEVAAQAVDIHAEALSTGVASSSSVIASNRCSSVAYSWRRSPANANARWRDFSRFLDNMDIRPTST